MSVPGMDAEAQRIAEATRHLGAPDPRRADAGMGEGNAVTPQPSEKTAGLYVICPQCGAAGWELAPHGEEPCPMKAEIDRAYIDKMAAEQAYYEAARMSQLRTANTSEGMLGVLRGIVGGEGDDE